MAEELFDIFFSGKLMPGTDRQQARAEVGKIFKASDDALNKLFSGKSVKIKNSVNMDTAIKYRLRFRDAGALIDIRPVNAKAPTPVSPPAQPASSSATHSPQTQTAAGTPMTETPLKPEQSSTTTHTQTTDPLLEDLLMPVGATIDETPAVAKLKINTDDLILHEANSGSLEEFALPVEAAQLPDISDMTFSPDDMPLDSTPLAEQAEIDISHLAIDSFSPVLDDSVPPAKVEIDTGSLTAGEANSGSLEEFNSRPAPQPLPDISKLEIIED